jgi:hypothetical protein
VFVKIKSIAVVSLLVFSAGCSFLEVKPETLVIKPTSKVFKFISKTPDGSTLDDYQIMSSLEKQIMTASKVMAAKSIYKCAGCARDYKGIETKRNRNEILVSYVNGEDYDTGRYTTNISGKYVIEINDIDGFKMVKVLTPMKLDLAPKSNPIFIPYKPLKPIASVASDINRINNRINPSFSRSHQYKGSVNVKFNDESVYANFRRELGLYRGTIDGNSKDNIKKEQVFNLGGSYVGIIVYPYRNGSKVEYSFYRSYSLTSDGKTSYDKMEVEAKKLIAKIKSVANA